MIKMICLINEKYNFCTIIDDIIGKAKKKKNKK